MEFLINEMNGAMQNLTTPSEIPNLYVRPTKGDAIFRSSSMAEHSAVNRRVVSSSLTCGANLINKLRVPRKGIRFYFPLRFPLRWKIYRRAKLFADSIRCWFESDGRLT